MLLITFLIASFFLICSEQPQFKNNTDKSTALPYQWQKMTDAAAFPKSYNFQMFAVRDTLWAMHPRGTYFSVNGKDWNKTPLPHFIQNSAFLDFIDFKGAIYSLGTFKGNIERYTMTSAIAKTTDFKNWELIAKESNLPRRFFYHPFVFNDKIWIIGGNDGKEDYNDIWNSTDAVHWTQVKANAAFGKRSGSQIVILNNKLFY
ncbi:MAG: hypothetical protein IPJ74_00205 [Saprospiraceae bacterium]|nr:hypothetical protein [Saprospiraceae bacterium]